MNTIPLAWLMGPMCSMRALRAGIGSGMAKWRSRVAIQLSRVYMIPLGRPVVPPVKRTTLTSSRSLSMTPGLSSLDTFQQVPEMQDISVFRCRGVHAHDSDIIVLQELVVRGQQVCFDENDFWFDQIKLVGLGLHTVGGIGKAGT